MHFRSVLFFLVFIALIVLCWRAEAISQADPYASGSILHNLVGFDAYRSGHYGNNGEFFYLTLRKSLKS